MRSTRSFSSGVSVGIESIIRVQANGAMQFERDAAGKPDDTELSRHVIGLAEIADQRRGRRHVHEGAAILLAEPHRAGPAHVEGAVEMYRQHVRPVRPAHAMEDAVTQDAGVVDQDVDAAEGGERSLHDLVGIFRFGDRQRRGDRLAAAALDLVDHLLRGRGIRAGAFEARADVAYDHGGALARHHQRNAAPDAAAGAGDDCDFAGHHPGHEAVSAMRPWTRLVIGYPQTSSATSTRRRSFAHSSSSLSKLPSSVEAKPHWP